MEHHLDTSFLRYLVELNFDDSTRKPRVFGIYDQAGYPLHRYIYIFCTTNSSAHIVYDIDYMI